jgi:HEPN domain-containing protein
MLPTRDLRRISKARYRDAEVLLTAGRYEGAVYLCGYAIEVALKARICTTLKWPGYPETSKEFELLRSFKVHDLDLLLRLTGQEAKIRTKCLAEWSAVAAWNPEARYKPIGSVAVMDAKLMLTSASILMKQL